MTSQHLRHRNKGFTLVELLVVISILGLLTAAFIPNLMAARRQSTEGATVAYLRNCVTAVESTRDAVTQELPQVTSCEDALLGDSRLARPTSVESTSVRVDSRRDGYLITVTSVTGKVYRHDGSTVLAGN